MKQARQRIRLKDIETVSATRAEPAVPLNVSPTVPEADDLPHRARSANEDAATVGGTLRAAREAHGWTIGDVAGHLRIRSNFLQALEDGRADELPGVAYAIGYVRAYAAFLDLDAEDAVRRFKDEEAALHSPTELVFPSPAPEGRVPGLPVLLLAVVLAGGAYGGWYVISEREGGLRGLVPDVPERLAALIDGDTPSTLQTTQERSDASVTPSLGASTAGTSAAEEATTEQIAPERVDVARTESTVTPVELIEDDQAPDAAEVAADPVDLAQTSVAADTTTEPVTLTKPLVVDAEAASSQQLAATPTPVVEVAAPVSALTTEADSPELPGNTDSGPVSIDTALSEPIPTIAETVPVDSALVDTVPASDAPAESAVVDAVVPAAPRIAGLIGASEAAVPSNTAAGSATTPVDRLVIRARSDSWVQIRDNAGHTLYTRVMREGDVYRVPDREGLSLATGNAGALDILVEGRMAPSLGESGQVVRNVALNPERLIAGTAIGAAN